MEGLAGTGMWRRLSLGSAWPMHSKWMNNPGQLRPGCGAGIGGVAAHGGANGRRC